MRSFLSVARGSEEPCKFLEIHYKGLSGTGTFKPSVAFVGKGITFGKPLTLANYCCRVRSLTACHTSLLTTNPLPDSGGISLKPGAGMKLMRADMGGAACVTSAAWAIAKLQIPIDLIVCTPLTGDPLVICVRHLLCFCSELTRCWCTLSQKTCPVDMLRNRVISFTQ